MKDLINKLIYYIKIDRKTIVISTFSNILLLIVGMGVGIITFYLIFIFGAWNDSSYHLKYIGIVIFSIYQIIVVALNVPIARSSKGSKYVLFAYGFLLYLIPYTINIWAWLFWWTSKVYNIRTVAFILRNLLSFLLMGIDKYKA